jgi:hypothetical protein
MKIINREDFLKLLKRNGFRESPGAKHECWTDGVKKVYIPRKHKNENNRLMFQRLAKEANLK